MTRPRTTSGKRQRQEQKRQKAQAKVERRVARQADSDEPAPEVTGASESELMEALADLHRALEAGDVPLNEFEDRREIIRTQLEQLQ